MPDRPPEILPPLFDLFSAKQKTRYDMERPWTSGGWVYATDGRVSVRMPSSADLPADHPPPLENLFSSWRGDPDPAEPIFYCIANTRCDECSGKNPRCKGDPCYGIGKFRKGCTIRAIQVNPNIVRLIQHQGAALFYPSTETEGPVRFTLTETTIEGLIAPLRP